MKVKVKLVFPSLERLWEFVTILSTRNMQISTRSCTLTALCTPGELQEAITGFGATLVSNEQTKDPYA